MISSRYVQFDAISWPDGMQQKFPASFLFTFTESKNAAKQQREIHITVGQPICHVMTYLFNATYVPFIEFVYFLLAH